MALSNGVAVLEMGQQLDTVRVHCDAVGVVRVARGNVADGHLVLSVIWYSTRRAAQHDECGQEARQRDEQRANQCSGHARVSVLR